MLIEFQGETLLLLEIRLMGFVLCKVIMPSCLCVGVCALRDCATVFVSLTKVPSTGQ